MDTPTFGGIPSPTDYRDQLAAKSVFDALQADLAILPVSFHVDLSKLGDMILDQNKIPACVSHAWALVMKYWWWKKTGEVVDFSPRYLDILSAEDWIPVDGGRVPRTVCKISAVRGCCTTKLLPNDTEGLSIAQYRDKSVITQAMHDEAAKYRIPGYVRIPDNKTSDFRGAIYQLGIISGLFTIDEKFWTPSWKPEDILPLRTPGVPVSGHEMVVEGWEINLNWLINSWSKLWGMAGRGTYDPTKWLPYIAEGWAIAVVPANIKDWLSSLPKHTDFHYQWNTDMTRGQDSDDIKMLQIAYMILGHLDPATVAPEDLGHWGPKTSKANLKYQTVKNIFPTAPDNAGPKTRKALNADFVL